VGRTLLIGLDGATWTILDPFMERGLLPNLEALTQRGTRAQLRSIMPPLTPPAWTSLMTGKHPGRHGVFDFFQKEDGDSIHFRFASSLDVRADTIWSLASDEDLGVISLNFPLMFPAPDVNGFVVPGGMMPWRQLRLGCHPAGLFDRLKQLRGL
jgi:predicted AlkP superfamily phosphohydrolase/phosphomutase